MDQLEINERIYDILKCLVHSSDKYDRGVVDLNTVALLRKLGEKITKSVKCPECGKTHFPDKVFGEYCNSECYDYHCGHRFRPSTSKPSDITGEISK